MGVEWDLVDHERREHYDLGKGLAGAVLRLEHSPRLPCGRYPLAVPEVDALVREWKALPGWKHDDDDGESYFRAVAEEVAKFIREHPGCCLHSDAGDWFPDEAEGWKLVGSRYRDG